ncbi:MAG: hypothetical protein ACKE8G_02470 [Methylophagaceae bacterium]
MKSIVTLLTALLFSVQVQAALVSVSGQGKIVSAKHIQEDSPTTGKKQKGFDEQQGVELTRDIEVDDGFILEGTKVDSHIIFFNSKDKKEKESEAFWEFDGKILGVMSNSSGSLLMESNDLLAAFDNYFTKKGLVYPFDNLGMEGLDEYHVFAITGDTVLSVFMHVTEPGDWIRVITASAVPVPAAIWLFGSALFGLVGLRRKTK